MQTKNTCNSHVAWNFFGEKTKIWTIDKCFCASAVFERLVVKMEGLNELRNDLLHHQMIINVIMVSFTTTTLFIYL